MRDPDPAAEVQRLIAADPADLPTLIEMIAWERAADAYFLHGVGSDAPPPVGVLVVDRAEAPADDA